LDRAWTLFGHLLRLFLKRPQKYGIVYMDKGEIIIDKTKGCYIIKILAPRLTSRKGSGGVFYLYL